MAPDKITPAGTAQDSPRKTLLLVDDTPENLDLLGDILMPHYRVRVANSGARALAIAASSPKPDLILLDVMMPDMDGHEVLRRMRADAGMRDIPVIFVTALDSTEDEAQGLALGAVDYITKPVRPAIVLARVKTQLELKEARDILHNQNELLESEVQRRMQQNQLVQDVTMRALASIAETRDNETGAHILRTQNYVRVLAEELARSPRYREALTRARIESYVKAAPLHDLGKVGIPDHVLHKRGKLDADEWEIMKTHAKLGADAIRRVVANENDRDALGFLFLAIEIANFHHEKWDGSGYPDGLSGEEIPLSARLMAVADVFDALITQRVYKPAFTIEKAASIILEGRGTHFDPDVVDAFRARIDDIAAVAHRYVDAPEPHLQSTSN